MRGMVRGALILALGLGLWAVPAGAQEASLDDLIRQIESAQGAPGRFDLGLTTIDDLMESLNVPGVSIAVIQDFEIHWAKGYGIADVETGAAVDAETLFQAASISKPVAAVAVMRAVQDGMFSLDTDINDILTSWELDGAGFTDEQPVTPRSLTSHVSGLGDGFGFPGYDPNGPIPSAVQVLDGHSLSNVGPLFMERAPYVGQEYSGGGVTLMQQALADAHGRAFEDVMRDVVLDPIGMHRSTFDQPLDAERDRNTARAHDGDGLSRGPKWHVYPEQAAAGLWTTPTELALLLIEVQKAVLGESDRVLSRVSALEMLSPVGVGGFGIGWAIGQRGRGWYFSHGGANWGFRATVMAHRLHGYGLAIMTNGDGGGTLAAELSDRIAEAYGWDSTLSDLPRGYNAVERQSVDLPASTLERYVGTYEGDEPIGRIEVTFDGSQLFVQPSGAQPIPIHAESETIFYLEGAQAEIEFALEGGDVTAALVRLSGREIRAVRVEGHD
ncbi:MAG: serine hydrolase [Gemmatimonadota bacterium]